MRRKMMGWLVCVALLGAAVAEAGVKTSNQFFYKPSLGARGTAEMSQFDAGLDLVDAHLGKYKTLGDPGYETLAAALSTIGSTPVSLVIPAGTVNITAHTTIPANVHLVVQRGGIFSIANGITLTIQGVLSAGPYQIFSGSGTATLGPGSPTAHQVYPVWWYSGSGHWNTALNAAMAAVRNAGGGKIVLTSNISISAAYVHDYYYASFDGNGYLIDASAINSGVAISITNSNNSDWAMAKQSQRSVANFMLKGSGKTGNVVGMLLEGNSSYGSASHLTLKNINIHEFAVGLKEYSYAWEVDCFKVDIRTCSIGLEIPDGGTTYGARLSYYGGLITGCTTAVRIHYPIVTVHFFGTAFDWCARLADIHGGKLVLNDCHVETIGAEAGGATEAIKVDGYGGVFQMLGGWYVGGGQSGNTQYLVNVVLHTNIAVFKDVMLYDVVPGSGYLATGNGNVILEPLIGTIDTSSYGLRWDSYTRGDLADGSFETAAGGQFLDDWYVMNGGTYSSRWSRANLALSVSNEQARTGTWSLKANKTASGPATFETILPVPRKAAMAAWQFWYRKPGTGTGTMSVTAHWVKLAGYDTNGIPIWGRSQQIGNQDIAFTSAAVPWTQSSDTYFKMWGDAKAPEWATHFVLRFNLDNLTSGQAYYFDDLKIFLN